MSITLALFELFFNVELVMRDNSRVREFKRKSGIRGWFLVYFSKRAERDCAKGVAWGSNFIPIYGSGTANDMRRNRSLAQNETTLHGAFKFSKLYSARCSPTSLQLQQGLRDMRPHIFFCLINFINSCFVSFWQYHVFNLCVT